MNRVALASAAIGVLSTALGQTPRFDIADVHTSAYGRYPKFHGSGGLRAGRYELRKATILDLIKTAYAVDADLVLGGPSWLDWDRFDVSAKAPASTSPDKLRLMLQALLADRFGLVFHKDTKTKPAFVLSAVSGKPKLKEADGTGETGCQSSQPPSKPPARPVAQVMISCRNVTMEGLALTLRGLAFDYLTSPVVDQTGLKGSFDFDLIWTGKALLPLAGSDGVPLFDAIDKQLGLKLEPREVPIPAMVVDSVRQKPTANAPEVATMLPPTPPPMFEVASIRPTPPRTASAQIGPRRDGYVERRSVSLEQLIWEAWDLDFLAEIAGAPKWLNFSYPRFDLIAKATSSTVEVDAQFINNEDLQLMLRALLVDRFKMAVHYETRPMDAYSLVAAKPKLKPADRSNRAGCKATPSPAFTVPVQTVVTCQNVTMGEFSERLQRIQPSVIHYPVLDATGIEGAWDFTLTFNPTLPPSAPRDEDTGAPGGAVPAAADPTFGVSLFEALNKQLGLKLEVHKRPEPVFVMDHVEEKPTDN